MVELLVGIHAGARHDDGDPLAEARACGAGAVQLFLADPQDWKQPKAHPLAAQIAATDLTVYVHAPYTVNVATTNNRIRIPSRKLLAAHAAMAAELAAELGAAGLVVHGGHVLSAEDEAAGVDNWRKTFARQQDAGGFGLPVLIENTAGGSHAMARRLPALARLWEAVGPFGAGFVLDTCHAWAGGIDLATAVADVRAVTGRVDLVHCNNSRDDAGSGRDRHAGLLGGSIPLDLLVDVVRSAGAPVVLETPGGPEERRAEIAVLRDRLG